MFFMIDKVITNQYGGKIGTAIETYQDVEIFLKRYKELLSEDFGGEKDCHQYWFNYNFGYEIMDDSQSNKIAESIYLSDDDLKCLYKQFPLKLSLF